MEPPREVPPLARATSDHNDKNVRGFYTQKNQEGAKEEKGKKKEKEYDGERSKRQRRLTKIHKLKEIVSLHWELSPVDHTKFIQEMKQLIEWLSQTFNLPMLQRSISHTFTCLSCEVAILTASVEVNTHTEQKKLAVTYTVISTQSYTLPPSHLTDNGHKLLPPPSNIAGFLSKFSLSHTHTHGRPKSRTSNIAK